MLGVSVAGPWVFRAGTRGSLFPYQHQTLLWVQPSVQLGSLRTQGKALFAEDPDLPPTRGPRNWLLVKAPEPMGRERARGGREAPAWVLEGTLLLDLKTGQTRGPVTQTRRHSGMCWRMRHRYSVALTCFKLFPLVDVRTLNVTEGLTAPYPWHPFDRGHRPSARGITVNSSK